MFSVPEEREPHPEVLTSSSGGGGGGRVGGGGGGRVGGAERVVHQSLVKDFFIFWGGFILETGTTEEDLQAEEHAAADDVSAHPRTPSS